MKLLFVCGYEISGGCLKTASWIQSIIECLEADSQLILVGESTGNNRYREVVEIEKREIVCYKFGNKDFSGELKKILQDSKPDTVIIFGTENELSLKALNACREEKIDKHTAVLAQGFCTVCAKHYAEGLPHYVVKRYTLRDFFRHDRVSDQIKRFQQNAVKEQIVLRSVKNFIGRTTIDKALLKAFNQTARYYKCNDVLRSTFYADKWRYATCEKHRIFVSQYYYPIKGFHFLLEAVSIVKKRFSDVVIAASGYNPINRDFLHKELKDSSYIAYLKELVRKHHLENNICLLGNLDEEEMKAQYLMANVFAMPSVIENSPNSLAEAMMLGVPAVVSDVGGVTDFAEHRKEAYIYPSTDPYLLAHYIMDIFDNADIAEKMSEAARKRASIEFDREKNIEEFKKICEMIAQDK